ncbi:uncharacterized protein LOC105163815 [Sesamum indicum]|uniref:Uncharacterized protein LOC105163815 n=1 Tax=Sesamum indicum TaxID=4182 RepID=A0A6I9T8F8_SESIN|nr:uncharacterized protein LOC105163815 [Sesamum indicum]
MANFCCSIELEPRTLNQGQLNHVREIAVDIVQRKEPDDEASMILNHDQGLRKPVVATKETVVLVVSDVATPPPSKEVIETEITTVETYCQCSASALTVESSPEECRVKEPLSAPF